MSHAYGQRDIARFAGKWVRLDLRFADGTERAIPECRVLGAGGPTGFVVDGGALCWPTSVRYTEVQAMNRRNMADMRKLAEAQP